MKITRSKLRRLILESLHNLPGNGKPYIPPFDLNELLKDQALKWSMQFDKGDPSMAALGHEAWVKQVQHGINILGSFLFEYSDIANMSSMLGVELPSVELIYKDAVMGTYDLLVMGHFYNNPEASWIEFIADSEDLKKELADMGRLPQQFVDLMGDDDEW